MNIRVPGFANDIIQNALKGKNLPLGLMFYRYLDGSDTKNHYSQLQNMINSVRFATLTKYRNRLLSMYQEYNKNPHLQVSCFRGNLVGRLAPGLGIPSVFENGISLHHIHGFPYIPGSSLKGIAQDYALKMANINKDSKEFISVFGKQAVTGQDHNVYDAQQGKVCFFDAIPLVEGNSPDGKEILTPDIMTPHYTEYYKNKGGISPGDYFEPNPITFLTVKEGTPFLFCLKAEEFKNGNNGVMRAKDVLGHAERWLKGALSDLGAGAKTSSGYGYFKDYSLIYPAD